MEENNVSVDEELAQKKKIEKKWIILGVVLLILCIGAGGAFLFYDYSNRIYTRCMTEAGTSVLAEDFLKNPEKEAVFVEDGTMIDTTVPGDYEIDVKSGMFTYHCVITVEDTIAPVGTVEGVYTQYGIPVEPDAFVKEIDDKTEVTVSYESEPNYEVYGKQEVTLKLTDLGGNVTSYQSELIIRSTVEELTLEAGSEPPVLEDFLLTDQTDVVLKTSLENIDMNTVKDYEIQIEADKVTYPSTLHVVDTVAPVLECHDVSAFTTSKLSLESFVTSAEDVTAITYAYTEEPDFSKVGTQQVTIQATDEGGNTVEQTVNLSLAVDTEAPVISGTKDITVYIGNSINYKSGVSVRDNCDQDIALSIDNSKVNLSAEGSYSVIYSAKDRAGNETSSTITVTVRKQTYDQSEIDALADQILAGIITEGMAPIQKLSAIYSWVRGNVRYINHSDKGNWLQAAYEGMVLHKGDCYVYASTSKALLTRAGITNADIHKIPAATQHFWNLVDIGEGWYHFDTTPRKDKPTFCYVNDETLMAYSNSHNLTHNYDHSVYTGIN